MMDKYLSLVLAAQAAGASYLVRMLRIRKEYYTSGSPDSQAELEQLFCELQNQTNEQTF